MSNVYPKDAISEVQLAAASLDPPEFSPLDPIVNKSCNIERCGKKINQIVANKMLSQYLQLKLNLL